MEMEIIRNYDPFITLKIEFKTANDFHTNLTNKYKALLNTLQLTDEDLIILSANPHNRRDPITEPIQIPNNITVMIPYFYTTRSGKQPESRATSNGKTSLRPPVMDSQMSPSQ